MADITLPAPEEGFEYVLLPKRKVTLSGALWLTHISTGLNHLIITMMKHYPIQDEGFDVTNGTNPAPKKKRSVSVFAILAIIAVAVTLVIILL
jgi:hypothetical protein